MISSRKIALFLLVFGASGALSKDRPLLEDRRQNLLSWCENGLDLEAKNLKTELCTLIGVDEAEWTAAKTDFEPEYKDACQEATEQELAKKPLPEKLILPIYNVLHNPKIRAKLGIIDIERDPNNIHIKVLRISGEPLTIARGTQKINSEAATDQFTVLIEPNELFATHADSAEIEATIAHELIHVINQDDFEVFCLDKLYKKNRKKYKVSRKKFRRLKGQWERLQEERADLLSGKLNLEYARASRDNFERNMPAKESLKITSTHPTDRQRFEYMAKLVNTMERQKADLIALLIIIILLIAITTSKKITKRHASQKAPAFAKKKNMYYSIK